VILKQQGRWRVWHRHWWYLSSDLGLRQNSMVKFWKDWD